MKELTIQESKNLTTLARQIRDTYSAAEDAARHARDKCNAAVAEALLCGQALNQAKKIIGHGRWLEWLQQNCPDVTERTAQKYMRLANTNHDSFLDGRSLRQAYLDAGIIQESEPKPKEQQCQENDSSRSTESLKQPESPSPSPSPSQPSGITCSPSIQTADSSPSLSAESNCPNIPSSTENSLSKLCMIVRSLMDEISRIEWQVEESDIAAALSPIRQWFTCRGHSV